jgi:hypothetical protein
MTPRELSPPWESGLASKNMAAMTEAERFLFLDTQTGTEPLLLNLVAMQGNGPKQTD